MKTSLSSLLLATTLLASTAAFAAEPSAEVKSKFEYKRNGGYEVNESAEKTTAGGTAVSANKKVDVSVDNSGKVDSTVKTEEKADPKGLMNAKKVTSEATYSDKSDGGYKHKTTEKSHDAKGADVTHKTTHDVDVDKHGNVTATETTEKSVDPKGLLNETTSTLKTKKVNGKVIEKKVD